MLCEFSRNKVLLEEDIILVVTLGGPERERENRSCGAGAALLSMVAWRPHLDLIPRKAIQTLCAPVSLSIKQEKKFLRSLLALRFSHSLLDQPKITGVRQLHGSLARAQRL